MEFTKWHGLGNDFVLVEGRPDRWPPGQLASLASRICDRHFGVGGDGLMFIFKDDQGTVNMRIFNADGSEPEMCGNGLRCVAKYAYLRGLAPQRSFDIKTKAGVMVPEIIMDGDRVAAVKVDMGEPVLDREQIPVLGAPGARMIEEECRPGRGAGDCHRRLHGQSALPGIRPRSLPGAGWQPGAAPGKA